MSGEFASSIFIGFIMTIASVYYGFLLKKILSFWEKLVWGVIFGVFAIFCFINAGFFYFAGKSIVEFF